MYFCIQVIYFLESVLYKGVKEGKETFLPGSVGDFWTQKFDS